jgi:hypothetical protein
MGQGRPFICAGAGGMLLAAAVLVAPPAALAMPEESLPVGDPIHAELRVLDLYASAAFGDRLRLPHLGTLPLQRIQLQGAGPPPPVLDPVRRIAIARLERVLGRDPLPGRAADPRHAPTPRLLTYAATDRERIELSAGLEGAGATLGRRSRFETGSGFHLRSALGLDRWLVYAHFYAGHVDGARRFADPIVPGNDFILHTEDTYLAYTAADGAWSGRLGRSRWHWGPGEEGSLILSRSAPAITGLSLAAHFGVTETARYRAEVWQPLYLVGAIPYILVQRFQVQDAPPDSFGVLRNNIQFGLDASWRVADGTRLYGELLIDDLEAGGAGNPDKLAWQLGWEGAGTMFGQRLTWGGELTRVWRYVYTSFFGREYSTQGEPLGFPTGPDARRLRVRGAWDPSVDWQMFGRATLTDRGENRLGRPFRPGDPGPTRASFEGVVERSREIEAGLRWWPAGGVDLAVAGGYRWVEDAAHVAGVKERSAIGRVEVRLTR